MDIDNAFGLIAAATGSVKGIAETASAIRNLIAKDSEASDELNEKISALLDQVIAAKQINIQAIDAIDELRARVAKKEKFDLIMSKYQMVETQAGQILYAYRRLEGETDPDHYICPICVDNERRTILQGHSEAVECIICKHWFYLRDRQ